MDSNPVWGVAVYTLYTVIGYNAATFLSIGVKIGTYWFFDHKTLLWWNFFLRLRERHVLQILDNKLAETFSPFIYG